MALDIIYDVTLEILRIVGSGVVTMEDRLECFRNIANAPEYAAARHLLVNVTEVTNPPAVGDVPAVINLVKGMRSRIPGRMAIVNGRVGHVTISSIIAISSDPAELSVKVFLAEEEALAWILG